MTLGEKIKQIEKINPDSIVTLSTKEYGSFWTGKAKFVFGAVSMDAWKSTEIEAATYDK